MSKRSSRRRKKKKTDPLLDVADSDIGSFLTQKLTTPLAIDKNVQQFCNTISPGKTPFFLDVQPPDWSRLNYCNKNVERMIQLYGGKIVALLFLP